MRYLPLGSPWSGPNQSYVHVPSGPWPVGGCGAGHERGVRVGGYREGGIPGSTQLAGYPLHWYCQDPTSSPQALSASTRALQAPWALRTPWLLALRYWPSNLDIGRDSINNILKLVKTAECRLNMLMRPGILPVSKRGPKYTTLNFQDFHIRGPSLPRNKWSRI